MTLHFLHHPPVLIALGLCLLFALLTARASRGNGIFAILSGLSCLTMVVLSLVFGIEMEQILLLLLMPVVLGGLLLPKEGRI